MNFLKIKEFNGRLCNVEEKIKSLEIHSEELERNIDSKGFDIESIEKDFKCIRDEFEKLNDSINSMKEELKEQKKSPINSDDKFEFIGDDEGVGTYLRDVKVYEEIDLYRIGEVCNFAGDKLKTYKKSWEKGDIIISLKVSSDFSSKKEVFNAIKRAYPKLLEYFRQ